MSRLNRLARIASEKRVSFIVRNLTDLAKYLSLDISKQGMELADSYYDDFFIPWLCEKYPKFTIKLLRRKGVDLDEYDLDPESAYIDEEDLGSAVSYGLSLEDFPESIFERFRSYFREELLSQFMEYGGAAEVPSFLYMEYVGVVKNQWLIHFTPNPESVAKEGFTRGVRDYTALGWTSHMPDSLKKSGGYNFAYLFKDASDLTYISNFMRMGGMVVFRASGILVEHNTDEEDQVIFEGSTARDIVPVRFIDGKWTVQVNGRVLFASDDHMKVAGWVTQNYAQYRKFLNQSPTM